MLTNEELSRAIEFVKVLTTSDLSYILADALLCDECVLKVKCPTKEELDNGVDWPINQCDHVIRDYISTGEIVDRRKK